MLVYPLARRVSQPRDAEAQRRKSFSPKWFHTHRAPTASPTRTPPHPALALALHLPPLSIPETKPLRDWWNQLDKKRGSRPRCVLFVHGQRDAVSARLTALAGDPDVAVSPNDHWMPQGKPEWLGDHWDKTPADEARLDRHTGFVCSAVQTELRNWWLAEQRGNPPTPTWDIASTCTIEGRRGLLLVEAKAHHNELENGATKAKNEDNRRSIGSAIAEANKALGHITGSHWGLSKDHHFQLSNRFAFSWKLASKKVPVVLVYLGFLHAREVDDLGQPFADAADWVTAVKDHARAVADEDCWNKRLLVGGTPLRPSIRVFDQPFSRR